MRGPAETGPLEEFPVSLLKIEQRSSLKLGDPLLERSTVRGQIGPAPIRSRETSGKVLKT